MEGLLDHQPARGAITQVGGIDRCVSEFIRITDQLLPPRVFTRIVPELHNGSRTAAGTPVRPQLLGSDPPAWPTTPRCWPRWGPKAST
jgi:tRNA-dihydrouridine synthase C